MLVEKKEEAQMNDQRAEYNYICKHSANGGLGQGESTCAICKGTQSSAIAYSFLPEMQASLSRIPY